MIGKNLALGIREYGDRQFTKALEKQFGKHIGKVAPNGGRTFTKDVMLPNPLEKDVVQLAEEITYVDKNGKIKSVMRKFGDKIKGLAVLEKKGSQGQLESVSRIRISTNYRYIESMDVKTGEIKVKEININPIKGTADITTRDAVGNATLVTKNLSKQSRLNLTT